MTERIVNEESKARKADNEFFATPAWVTDAILPHLLPALEAICARNGYATVCDPCVGEGAILDRLAAATESWDLHKPLLQGIEIHEGRAEKARQRYTVETADALAVPWPKADLHIFNPPFSLAQAFAEKAIASLQPGGTVAMLARLAFLESAERYDFHQAHPSDAYVFASRPGFLSSSGATDMSAYGFFLFGEKHGGRWFPLAPSPAALEKARKRAAKKGGTP